MPNKINSAKGRLVWAHSLRYNPSWQRRHGGRNVRWLVIASAVKRQKELMLAPCSSSFYSVWDCRPWSQAVHTWVSPLQLDHSRNALTDLLRVLFPW